MAQHRFHLAFADLKKLSTFVTVVQCKGLSAAADELGVSLTTVSRAVTDLEFRLGVELCTRGRGGFFLTAHGLDLYEAATRLLENVTNFESDVNRVSAVLRGRLKIGIMDNLISGSDYRLVRAMTEVAAAYPSMFPEIYILQHGTIEEAVRTRTVDVGIANDPVYFANLEYKEVFHEFSSLYVANGTALDKRLREGAKLSEIPYIRRRNKFSTFQKMEKLFALSPQAMADGLEAAALLIASGVGIGFLPSHYVELFPQLGLRRIAAEPTPLKVPFYAIARAGINEVPTAAHFVRLLSKWAEQPAGPKESGREIP